jgi:uncharacterized damage-inducible protein DinB
MRLAATRPLFARPYREYAVSIQETGPEPWLRGAVPGVPPLVMPVFFSFAQLREDLKKHVAGLDTEQLWRRFGRNSVGFHLRHIAGSVDRLTTYLHGQQLTAEQFDYLKHEHEPGADVSTLLDEVEQALARSESALRKLGDVNIFEARTVGRQALPTTVIGLLVHLAEHTQRHLGQLITLAQIVRQPRSPA